MIRVILFVVWSAGIAWFFYDYAWQSQEAAKVKAVEQAQQNQREIDDAILFNELEAMENQRYVQIEYKTRMRKIVEYVNTGHDDICFDDVGLLLFNEAGRGIEVQHAGPGADVMRF